MLGEVVATSESFWSRELGAIRAWVRFGPVEGLYVAAEDIESSEGDATVAHVCSVLCLLGVIIKRGFVREALETFIAHDFSPTRDLIMGGV